MTLEPALAHALAVWRTELGHAAAAGETESRRAGLTDRRVVVHVSYTGDVVEALRAAGMETGFDSGELISGNIAMADVERLADVPGVELIRIEPRVIPGLDGTVKEIRVPWKVPTEPSPWPGKGAGVIIAVIDTGIDIFHESFLTPDKKTRILELWDQGATVGGSPPPAGFTQSLGRVYNANDINNALTAGPPFASVDSDGHGTHVAGIAAGDGSQVDRCSFPGRYVGVAPEADLVVVKAINVPGANIREALQWCAQARTRHANPPAVKPVVINGSFYRTIGPHDGTDELDIFVDEILRPGPVVPPALAVVTIAGNAADSELHETGSIPPNGSVTIPFFVPARSLKEDFLDIWYPGTATLNAEIIAPVNPTRPGPNTTGTVPPGAPGSPFPIGLMSLTVSSATSPMLEHNGKKRIQVTITPQAATPPIPVRAGVWQLKLTNTSAIAANWDAWFGLELDDGFPKFRLPTETVPVQRRRENIIGSPGNSPNAITVANYNGDELNPSSSLGPLDQAGRPAGERKPTLAAPGTSVTAPRSRDDKDTSSSCCDQLVIDKSGTSMAAPHVAGVVALMFEKNPTLTFEQVRATLQKTSRSFGIPPSEIPSIPDIPPATGIFTNHMWGSGKIDAAAALANIPAAPTVAAVGAGGAPGRPLAFAPDQLGLTPHTMISRLADWQRRFGARPGVNLFAALISEHVDEVLRLVNGNRRVTIAWRRLGGPTLVRWMLHGPPPGDPLIPRRIDGCDVAELLTGFVAVLDGFAGPRLRADLARYADFVQVWPGGSLARLDQVALALGEG